MSELPAVIIDNGSYKLKACVGGNEDLACCFPTVIGRTMINPFNGQGLVGMIYNEVLVGNQAKKSNLLLNYPIKCGVVENWDDMEIIWRHAFFNELKVQPENHSALFTEVPVNPKFNREKMTQIIFETFDAPSFYVAISAVLSLYASGRTKGIVVDSGDDNSRTVPIYEGYTLPHSSLRINLAGKANTEYLVQILKESKLSISSSDEMEIARYIKEKFCYVALDYEEEMNKYKGRPYELPDGSLVVIQNQIFRCPELLFKPNFNGLDVPGIHELTFKSIMKCDIDLRKDLYQNIILSGGNTLFPGLPARLSKELSLLRPQNYKIQVIAPNFKDISTLIGGSIFASLLTSSHEWITRFDYDENGPTIVHRKCF